MQSSPIRHRLEMFELINCVDGNGVLVFPDEIKIVAFVDNGNDTVKVVLDRKLNIGSASAITITESSLYNGDYSVNNISADGMTFDILTAFKGADIGFILGTGHKYKSTVEQITNLPAVLISLDETTYDDSNVDNMLIASNIFIFQVIDEIARHPNTMKVTALESAQDFIWNKAIEILTKISASLTMVLELDGHEFYETVIDKDKKCACLIARITITNR